MGTTVETVLIQGRETVSKAADKASRSLNGLGGSMKDVDNIALGSSEIFGSYTRRLRQLRRGAIRLWGPAGILVGAVAVNALLAASVVAAAAGIVKATRAAAEASEELEKLGLITASMGEELRETADSLDAVSTAFDTISVGIADSFSVELKEGARLVGAMGLALGDLAAALDNTIVKVFLYNAVSQVFGINNTVLASGLDLIKQALEDYTTEFDALAVATTDARLNTERFAEDTDKGTEAVKRSTKELDRNTKAVFRAAEALAKQVAQQNEALSIARQRAAAAQQQQTGQDNEQAAEDFAASELRRIESTNRARIASAKQVQQDLLAERRTRATVVSSGIAGAAALSAAIIGVAGKTEEAQRRGAIVSVLISGAQAIASVWAQHAANPIAAGALSVLAAGVTAAQIAAISSASSGGGAQGASGPAFTAPVETPQIGLGNVPGDLGGGGTFIVLGNEVFELAVNNALRGSAADSASQVGNRQFNL